MQGALVPMSLTVRIMSQCTEHVKMIGHSIRTTNGNPYANFKLAILKQGDAVLPFSKGLERGGGGLAETALDERMLENSLVDDRTMKEATEGEIERARRSSSARAAPVSATEVERVLTALACEAGARSAAAAAAATARGDNSTTHPASRHARRMNVIVLPTSRI
eukprot:5984832-Pleurochrysis_carterae.AAC.1